MDKKSEIDRTTSKLLLNGCYGRFDTRLDIPITKVIKKEEYSKIALKYEILNDYEIRDDLIMIEYKHKIKEEFLDDTDEFINPSKDIYSSREVEQSLPIAIARTAHSRIYMNMVINFFRKKNNILILYTDTDSLWISGNLLYSLVGDLIGQFKLEFLADEAYFPLAKVYYCRGLNPKHSVLTEIKKSKGLKSLSREEYIKLSNGLSIKKNDFRFIKNIKDLSIKYDQKEINIIPMNNKRIPIYKKNGLSETIPILVLDNIVEKNMIYYSIIVYENKFQLQPHTIKKRINNMFK